MYIYTYIYIYYKYIYIQLYTYKSKKLGKVLVPSFLVVFSTPRSSLCSKRQIRQWPWQVGAQQSIGAVQGHQVIRWVHRLGLRKGHDEFDTKWRGKGWKRTWKAELTNLEAS